jgi:hypothetical protein
MAEPQDAMVVWVRGERGERGILRAIHMYRTTAPLSSYMYMYI